MWTYEAYDTIRLALPSVPWCRLHCSWPISLENRFSLIQINSFSECKMTWWLIFIENKGARLTVFNEKDTEFFNFCVILWPFWPIGTDWKRPTILTTIVLELFLSYDTQNGKFNFSYVVLELCLKSCISPHAWLMVLQNSEEIFRAFPISCWFLHIHINMSKHLGDWKV